MVMPWCRAQFFLFNRSNIQHCKLYGLPNMVICWTYILAKSKSCLEQRIARGAELRSLSSFEMGLQRHQREPMHIRTWGPSGRGQVSNALSPSPRLPAVLVTVCASRNQRQNFVHQWDLWLGSTLCINEIGVILNSLPFKIVVFKQLFLLNILALSLASSSIGLVCKLWTSRLSYLICGYMCSSIPSCDKIIFCMPPSCSYINSLRFKFNIMWLIR
jgi:hypothetical protein